MIKKIHLWIGIVGMVLFLASGQYFQHSLSSLQDMSDTPRLLLRTSHVYFFFASIINIIFGMYYSPPRAARWYSMANQLLVMLSPVLIGYGFVFEAHNNAGIEREVGSIGVIVLFVWLLNTLVLKLIEFLKDRKAGR